MIDFTTESIQGRLRDVRQMQFPPAAECIYCETTIGRLTREHVMPFGMHGEMVIPKATCQRCARITSQIERQVLGKVLIQQRIRYGLKSRRKKRNSRASTFEIEFSSPFAKYRRSKQVSTKYLPWIQYALPTYEVPAVLRNCSPNTAKGEARLEAHVSDWDVQNMLKLGMVDEAVKWPVGSCDFDNFNRFLAKIAHSYLYATLGRDAFVPLLRDLILESSNSSFFFVGGLPKPHDSPWPGSPYLFEISHGEGSVASGPLQGKKLILVYIRLFSFLGTPKYLVVAGERRCDEKWFFEQPCYALPVKVSFEDSEAGPPFSVGI